MDTFKQRFTNKTEVLTVSPKPRAPKPTRAQGYEILSDDEEEKKDGRKFNAMTPAEKRVTILGHWRKVDQLL